MDMDERDVMHETLCAAADLVLELRVVEPGAVPRVQGNRHERRKAAALARRAGKMRSDDLVPGGSSGSGTTGTGQRVQVVPLVPAPLGAEPGTGTTQPLTRSERAAGHDSEGPANE